MSTPQTFTITETDEYSTTDGSKRYFLTAGTVIPMSLAIAMGLEGAGYDDPVYFTEAENGAIMGLLLPRWVTGRYYSLDFPPFSAGTSAPATSLSANQLRAHLLVIPPGGTIDRLVIPNITVAATAGSLARLGLYEYDTDAGYPGALVVDGGTVLVDTTGDRTVTVDVSPDPGIYVIAEVHNAAFTSPAFTSTGQSPLGYASGSGTAGLTWRSAFTFAALPDPFPAAATVETTTMKLMARAG